MCSRPECSYKSVRVEKLKLLSSFLTVESGVIYLALTWIVCILSLIPYLGVKRQLAQKTPGAQNEARYFNGLATAAIIVAGLSIAEYYFKYPINTLIYKNYQQLIFVGFVYALTITIWCFVRSGYVPTISWNPFAKSGRLISDLFIGREVNPRWLNRIDIKLIHRRIALISTLIFNLIFLTRNIKFIPVPAAIEAPLTNTEIVTQFLNSIRIDSVAATVSILIILYVIDALAFEHHLSSSFELQHEGVGALLLLRYASYPVWTSLFAKFALQHKIAGVPNWLLASISFVFIAGLIFKRLANELKYHYRVNPNSARSASKFFESIFLDFLNLFFNFFSKFSFFFQS